MKCDKCQEEMVAIYAHDGELSRHLCLACAPTPSQTLMRVADKMVDRERVGMSKYGTTVDRSDLNRLDWLIHFQEELMDAVLYVQRLIDIEKGTK